MKCFHLDPAKVAPYATHAQTCQDLGGTLAVIKSSDENSFVSSYAAGVLGQSTTITKYVFIGLTNVNGAWRWVDSTFPSYTNWQPGQPDSSGATAGTITPVVKDAAKTDWGWVVGGWDDNAQTSSQYGLCQKKAELCPSGWAYYAGTNKCFKTLTTVATYDVQTQNCQAVGGTLAIIKSAEENSFVTNYAAGVLGASTTVTKYAFIGLSNADGTWKWIDTTAASYTNWQPGQPDGTGTSVGTITPVVKDVAKTDWGWVVGGWDNNAATSNQYAVCQRAAYGTCTDGYNAMYALAGANFFNESELWFSGTPTDTPDFVEYVTNWPDAKTLGLVSIVNGKAKIAVDNKNIVPADSNYGRKSVRLNTKTVFNGDVVLMDFEHMPVGSGTWPAYWMTGPNWPVTGELDIIEEGHGETRNKVSGHTSGACILPREDESQMTGTWYKTYPDDVYYSRNCSQSGIGCCIKDDVGTFGQAVNDHQGGVVAVEWVKEKYFKLWFFKRSEIPADITAGNPSPSCWGKPVAFLRTESNCVNRFNDLRVTINISFCGMAVPFFPGSNDAEKTAACEDYVRNNPSAFNDAYWLVNYIKVFQK
ncbi:endo1,3(4)-beta-glucanase [Aphelenchoides avenae]|nr:endo1,3(4)-beta-glucanase [Aphelenchus avenae]